MYFWLKKIISLFIIFFITLSLIHIHTDSNEFEKSTFIYNDRDCQEHHHISSKECGACITKNEKYNKSYSFESISYKNFSTLINHKTTNHVEYYIFYNSFCRPPPGTKTA